jgi:hypothetical protein
MLELFRLKITDSGYSFSFCCLWTMGKHEAESHFEDGYRLVNVDLP